MKGLNKSIEYIQDGINNSRDTRKAIITAANSYDYINKIIKEIEEKEIEDMKNRKIEEIHFDPNEIEQIVLKRKDGEES